MPHPVVIGRTLTLEARASGNGEGVPRINFFLHFLDARSSLIRCAFLHTPSAVAYTNGCISSSSNACHPSREIVDLCRPSTWRCRW
eukprot:301041-Pleurochrysis_carterae.AAC.1